MSNSDATTPIDRPHPRAIVAGHGEFAAGLVSAVQQITGRGDQLIPVAVYSLGVEDIEALLRKRMLEADVRVIFTDLQAGSCTMASRRILRGMDDAVLIAGINLPTLLDFAITIVSGTAPSLCSSEIFFQPTCTKPGDVSMIVSG